MALVRVVFVTMLLVIGPRANAETCLHGDDESTSERARRDTAIRYLAIVHAEQIREQKAHGRFVGLSELAGLPSVPVGFVPKLLSDRWSYVIVLKDFFDPCGFTLLSDDLGTVYEAHPSRMKPLAKTGDQQ